MPRLPQRERPLPEPWELPEDEPREPPEEEPREPEEELLKMQVWE